MNIGDKKISAVEFHREFTRTGRGEHAIFSGRKPLLDKLFAEGIPIYCDQSYYVHNQEYDLVTKAGDHYACDCYTTFENWRDCHYFSEWADKDGNRVWLMTGGRYD